MIERNVLGQRIRAVRTGLKLTLKDVEAASGFSATHVSEIERGRTSPTIGALIGIASALGKDPNFFIEEEELEPIVVARNGTRAGEDQPGSRLISLGPGVVGGRFRSFLLTVTPDVPIRVNSEVGEACGYILAGRITLSRNGEDLSLAEGDAFHCLLRGEHTLQCPGQEAAKLVMIIHRSAVA